MSDETDKGPKTPRETPYSKRKMRAVTPGEEARFLVESLPEKEQRSAVNLLTIFVSSPIEVRKEIEKLVRDL